MRTVQKILRTVLLVVISVAMIFPMVKPAFAAKDDGETFAGYTNVLNQIDPQGEGSRKDLVVGTGYYSLTNSTKQTIIENAAKKGWLTNVQQNTSSNNAQDWHWVRYTEIVPRGDTPRAVLPQDDKHRLYLGNGVYQYPSDRTIKRFVPDDGTFVPPVQEDKAGNFVRNFGVEINGVHSNFQASYTFGNVPTFNYTDEDTGKDSQSIIKDDSLNKKWLPYNGYGNITLFSSDRGPDPVATTHSGKYNWYWCINPNAADPRAGYYYVKEPTRFSGQTNFQDLPGMAYMLTILDKISPLGEGNSPNFDSLYTKLVDYYNNNIAVSSNDSSKFPYDESFTNGDIRKVFNKLATIDGTAQNVDGIPIRVQQDRNAMGKHLNAADSYESNRNRQFTNLGVAIEYFLAHHSQGFPIEDIDKLLQVRQIGFGKEGNTFRYQDVVTMRALTRLLFAIEFAAKEHGALQQYDPTNPASGFKATLADVHKGDTNYSATIKLDRPDNDELLVAVSKGVQVQEQSSLTLVTPGKQSLFDSFYGSDSKQGSEAYYTVPSNIKELHVSYTKSSAGLNNIDDKPHPSVRFVDKQQKNVISEVFSSADSYEYNKESGHWLVKEYANFNYGMSNDQQVVSVTPRTTMVPQALALDLISDGATPTLSTTVEVNRKQSNITTPAQVTDDERLADSGVNLIDHVAYSNMVPGARYTLKGELFKVTDNGDGTYSQGASPISTKEQQFTVDNSGSGTWDLQFDASTLKSLEPLARYVVFETATPVEIVHDGQEVKVVDHKNPNDVSQTFTTAKHVIPPDVKTVVTVGSHMAKIDTPAQLPGEEAEKGVDVKDTIIYKNLKGGAEYNVEAKLYEVLDSSTSPHVQEDSPIAQTSASFKADPRGSGFASNVVIFSHVTQLQPGKTYVVFETLMLKSPASDDVWGTSAKPIEHKDASDKAQTIVVKPVIPPTPPKELSTTVEVGGRRSSQFDSVSITTDEASKGVDVIDHVQYKNFDPKALYTLKGELFKVVENNGKKTVESPAIALVEQTVTADKASGEWQVTFHAADLKGKLQSDTSYVVFETATRIATTSPEEPVIHHNPDDKSQILVVGPQGTLQTTVNAAGSASTSTAPAIVDDAHRTDQQGVSIVDTIQYTNLKPSAAYNVEGTLCKVVMKTDSSGEWMVDGPAVATKRFDGQMTTANGSGSWTLTFDNQKALDPHTRYVVFEKVTLAQPDETHRYDTTITHENPNDIQQSFVTAYRTPKLSTTVNVNDKSASSAAEALQISALEATATDGVHVVDHVTYTNLVGEYELTGKLMRIVKGDQPEEVATVTKRFTAESNGNGTADVDFKMVTNLQPGTTYVVFETAVPVGENSSGTDKNGFPPRPTVSHADEKDKAQTVVVAPQLVGKITTTVQAGSNTATLSKTDADSVPAFVPSSQANTPMHVVDTVKYENLIPNQQYELTGKLYKVITSGDIPQVGKSHLIAQQTVIKSTTQESSGTWSLDFSTVQLTPGSTYVVFETAVPQLKDKAQQEKYTVTHENPSDKAQTIVVRHSTGVHAVIGTTVHADTSSGSEQMSAMITAEKAIIGVPVTDTVHYDGLFAGHKYTLTSKLMKIIDDNDQVAIVKTVSKDFTPKSANGEVQADFGTLPLEADTRYVAFETVESVEKIVDVHQNGVLSTHVVHHENVDDKAQTITVLPNGRLATTVEADGVKAETDAVAVSVQQARNIAGVHVVDHVYYENLLGSYRLTGALMHIVDGKAQGDPVAVKTVAVDTKQGTTGEWIVDFGKIKGLVLGEKYVVFETAVPVLPEQPTPSTPTQPGTPEKPGTPVTPGVPSKPEVPTSPSIPPVGTLEHHNPKDKHQTIIVKTPPPTLNTTVAVNGVVASKDKPVVISARQAIQGAHVVDTVLYEGLKGAYVLTGDLMHIVNGKVEGDPVASRSINITVDSYEKGSVDVDFGVIENLVPGEKYVVFETAVPVLPEQPTPSTPTQPGTPTVPEQPKNRPDTSRPTVEHHNPNNPAQTVVVQHVPVTPMPVPPHLSKTGSSTWSFTWIAALTTCAAGVLLTYKRRMKGVNYQACHAGK